MNSAELRKYELMVIFSGDLPEADLEKELAQMRDLLKEHGKEVFYEESWGKRELAYRIKRQSCGHFVIFDFKATSQNILELRSNIKLNQNVLRHLLLALPENYAPEDYKKLVVLEEEEREDSEKKRARAPKKEEVKPAMAEEKVAEEKKPTIAGKEEEEELKTVEKKLAKILENPDIDIK